MACAPLVSLRRTIEKITRNRDQYTIAPHHIDQIRSIDELINVLQEFTDTFPEEANSLEGRISDVANEAQEVLEHFISKPFGLNKYIWFLAKFRRGAKFHQQLEKIREVFDSIARELIEMEKNDHKIEGDLQLSDSLATNWPSMLEMEEDDLQLSDSPAANSSSMMEMEEEELQLSDCPAASASSMTDQFSDSPAAKSSSVMEMEKNGQTIEDELQLSDSSATNSSSVIAVTSKINDAVGLDDDSLAIKTRLCGESPKLQVIPIVGMGGIGKTTLSRNVYCDPLTIQYFDVRAWITVSQDHSTQQIVSSLMDSLKEFVVEKSGQSDEETVYKSLKGRRYLIVMDDMWSTNAWDDVKDLFPNDHNGSRIILTTRLSDVAAYAADSSLLHEMRFMAIEQSWELLRQRVFTDKDCSPQLDGRLQKVVEDFPLQFR